MIWLSSFPRSGNTFLRNVLFEVYGLESSSYYEKIGEPENYTEYPFVKTHQLPNDIHPSKKSIPAVYLIRDGRDALVSMAHQRKDIYEPESNFRDNFLEAMIAAEGSYFGGWSNNVEQWIERTHVLIRFEDLIENPIEQVDRLNSLIPLPKKDENKLPTFQKLKFGTPKYGRGKRIAASEEEELDIIQKSFRKGKAFGWKEELDKELQNYFWSYHRNVMDRIGYSIDGGIKPLNQDMDHEVIRLLGQETKTKEESFKVLIEANKLLMHQNDGVKRYLLELLKALYPVSQNNTSRWQIDIYLRGNIIPLKDYGKTLFDVNKNENNVTDPNPFSKKIVKFLKFFIPEAYKTTVATYFKKILMKAALNFSQKINGTLYAFDKVKYGKERAQEKLSNKQFNTDKYDLIHVPLPQHFEPFVGTNNKFLVTIHDLTHKLFSEFHTSRNVELTEKGLDFFINENSDFLCISDCTKQDVLKHYKTPNTKLHTVYEAADNKKFRPNLKNNKGRHIRDIYNLTQDPFLFTLSTLEPRKNLANTIKAFEQLMDENPDLNVNLVIGGKIGWKSKDLLKLKHKKRIVFTGFVDENDLPLLYNEAEALCYISYYEGFGLPPLEAMSCKTPVIYGNNSSLKEFFEGYGLPAEPDDISSIKEQMKKLLTDKVLKAKMAEKALERSFDFSWRQTAIDTLEVYENVINKNKSKN